MSLFDRSDTPISPPVAARTARRRIDLMRLRPADLFDAWLFAETDATLALAAWQAAPRSEKSDAHVAYLAALDREQHAAEVLENRVRAIR
jgi:hypothetical protein